MYAIIATGGKQYKVSEGDVIRVEKIEAEKDAEITFDQVLAVGGDALKVGDDVKGASVKATVLEQGKADSQSCGAEDRDQGCRIDAELGADDKDQQSQNDDYDRHDLILSLQERKGTFSDESGDLLHPVCAFIFF